ncbi:MAG: PTS sugar transporter subunit IIA [Pirellulales bacterium]|nr:PTS sugar transporter subunit IIA [Pirellulales bacterium]
MQLLRKALTDGNYLLDLDAHDLSDIFRETIGYLVSKGVIDGDRRDEVEAKLLEREQQGSTAIGHAVAVPHVYLDGVAEPTIVFIRLANPINLGAPDGIPTHFVFVLLGPPEAAAGHLDTLTTIARIMADDEFRYELSHAQRQVQLLETLDHFLARAARPAKPREERLDGLEFSGQLCGGLLGDVRRRWKSYASDFHDGLRTRTLSSTTFLFFACLAPAVTFGGIMGAVTDGQIGVVEMLVASAACGIVYALFSGQPLIILGGVGPLLIFTGILYRFCTDMQVAFLPTYMWVGLWTGAILVALAATDASCLMRFFTRFTDEIFSVLMALIFIYEAGRALVSVLRSSLSDLSANHDAAFLALALAFGTYSVAMTLSRFRRSKYLLPMMREFLADFGPTIALVTMTLVAWALRNHVTLDTLQAPEVFETTTGRSWLVDPWQAPVWIRWAAVLPALVAAVLIYLTQNITARLINSPDHKLQKGSAYHLDLAIVGALVAVCSLFGLPWLVAATVRSLAHVRGLAELEEVVSSDGGTRERVIHVHENRVTGLAIHVLLALSLLFLPLLQVVPMAVLYGVFLYMGVVSLAGNQFFDRLTLWLTDPDLYPRAHYLSQAPRRVIHSFTLMQFVCLVILCGITLSSNKSLRLSFPLFIALLVPVRVLIGRLFAKEYLSALDAEETPEQEESDWSS